MFNPNAELLLMCTTTTPDVQEYNFYAADKELVDVGDRKYYRVLRLVRRSQLTPPVNFQTCVVESSNFMNVHQHEVFEDAVVLATIQYIENSLITRRGIILRVNALVAENENAYIDKERNDTHQQLTDLVSFIQGCIDSLLRE